MCKVNLVPRIFYLSPSREEEREPWERGWCKVTFRGQVYRWKWVLELKAVLYFSADLCLTALTIRGNHDLHNRDRRGLACVAWRVWLGALSNMGGRGQRNWGGSLPSTLLSCRFGEHHSIMHLYGFLVVSIVANDISKPTVYGNLIKMCDFPFWIYFVWKKRSAPD